MRGFFLRIWPIFAAFFLTGPVSSPAIAGPAVNLKVVGPPETVFRWRTDRCAPNHIPDAPARAFRDAQDRVHLVAAHHINRAMVGPTLEAVRVDCAVIFRGARSSDPAALDDMIWLTAFDTADGRRIVALGHAEFHGHRVPGLCPAGRYMDCWRNAVIAALG